MHLLCPRTARQSRDCLRVRVLHSCTAIFAPAALFPGISRRCTGRCVRLRQRSPRYRHIRFNRECHPSWHLRRLASRRYASHRNPTASAQAVCHPLSGGSVACLVSACASLHAGDRALCAVIAFQCSAVQLIAVQCLPIRFAPRFGIAFSLCKARPESRPLLTIGASAFACADSHKEPDRRIARADEERQRGAGDVERGGVVQTPQMCEDMVTGGIPP